jgi:hypothetical protein
MLLFIDKYQKLEKESVIFVFFLRHYDIIIIVTLCSYFHSQVELN